MIAEPLQAALNVEGAVQRHRARRKAGVTTISVIETNASEVGVLHQGLGLGTRVQSAEQLLHDWFRVACQGVRAGALEYLAEHLGRGGVALKEPLTPATASSLVDAVLPALSQTEAAVLRWLLSVGGDWASRPSSLGPRELVAALNAITCRADPTRLLLDGTQCPAHWLEESLQQLANVVSVAQFIELTVCATAQQIEAAQHATPTQALTLLQEGLIDQRSSAHDEAFSASGYATSAQSSTRMPPTQAMSHTSPVAPQTDRAVAERQLHRCLEAHPATRGLFALHGQAAERPMNRELGQCEVDLLCKAYRIAIEVDGHFQVLSLDEYRRDRRKDLALQKAGYLVLRFHAEDVSSNLSDVLSTVVSAISHRTPTRSLT